MQIFYAFPASSLQLSCIEYRIAARKKQDRPFLVDIDVDIYAYNYKG